MMYTTMEVIQDVELARHMGETPRVHPNGFIQLNLDSSHDDRLHVWHPDVPSQGINTIHDHVFHMESTIVKGHMTNKTFDIHIDRIDDLNAHAIWRVVYEPGSFEAKLVPMGQNVAVNLDQVTEVAAGGSYFQYAGTLHVADNSEICATRMQRQTKMLDHSIVVLPRGESPTEFSRASAMSVDRMWGIIEEVLDF